MKIVDMIITKFVEKVLNDMEKISEDLSPSNEGSFINQANQELKNQDVYRRLFRKQALLAVLRMF